MTHGMGGHTMSETIEIVGGGLAGCEAALFLARRGHPVRLCEMRPARTTPAHTTERLGELVCTNSFKSEDPANAHGQLKREMEALGSLLLEVARRTRVPAGSALAVDRDLFSLGMTEAVARHPGIEVVREERTDLPEGPAIVATGPLTSQALSQAIRSRLGREGLAFFDAIAPIVHGDSLDREVVFQAGRFGEDADYLNCPMAREEYEAFLGALRSADVHPGHDFEAVPFFEGCLPVEVMAARGDDTLRFGPMKPIGLRDPRTGRGPHAVVQPGAVVGTAVGTQAGEVGHGALHAAGGGEPVRQVGKRGHGGMYLHFQPQQDFVQREGGAGRVPGRADVGLAGVAVPAPHRDQPRSGLGRATRHLRPAQGVGRGTPHRQRGGQSLRVQAGSAQHHGVIAPAWPPPGGTRCRGRAGCTDPASAPAPGARTPAAAPAGAPAA